MKKDKLLKFKFWWPIMVIVLIGLIMGRTLLTPRLAVSHDLELHAARLANYYLALKQGQFPPRLAPNLNYGFGYPTYIFAYQYTYLIGSFLFAVFNSIELSLNIFLIFSMIWPAIGIYLLSLAKTKNNFWSFIVSLSFMTTPYLLLDTFVRGVAGEIGFLSLLPWVMLLLYFRKKVTSYWYIVFLPIILVMWFVAHQMLVLVSLPILAGWVLVEELSLPVKKRLKKNEISLLFLLLFLSVLMVICSWWPMLSEKPLVALSKSNYMQHSYSEQFPKFSRLIWSKWQYSGLIDRSENGQFTQMIGIVQLLLFVISLGFLSKQLVLGKVKQNLVLIYWSSVFLGSVFLMIDISKPIWELLTPLQYLQQPWRLLFLTTFSSAMIFMELLKKEALNIKVKGLIFLIVIIYGSYAIVFWCKPVAYFSKPVEQWLHYHLTADSYQESMPLGFDLGRNLRLVDFVVIKKTGQPLFPEINSNHTNQIGQVKDLNWLGSRMSYQVISTQAGQVVQKTAFYPGWKVAIDGQLVPLTEDREFPGRIVFPVSPGEHQVNVWFSDQGTDRLMADKISLLGLFGWLTIGLILGINQMRSFKKR